VQPERRAKLPIRHTIRRNRQECFMKERILSREINNSPELLSIGRRSREDNPDR
jgi:hypothetical protein